MGAAMIDELSFAFALLVSGLSIGLMYSLIALGFVLVYKAADVEIQVAAVDDLQIAELFRRRDKVSHGFEAHKVSPLCATKTISPL